MRNRILLLAAAVVAVPLALSGCLRDGADTVGAPDARSFEVVKQPAGTGMANENPDIAHFQGMLDNGNAALAAQGLEYRITQIEWMSRIDGVAMGNTVFFGNVGNKRLTQHWVPDDPRRFGGGAGDAITYLIDESAGATANGLTNADTEPAIQRAMDTWNNVACSAGMNLVRNPDLGVDPTIVDGILGFGPFGVPQAQITHGGWVGGAFPPTTIAVTFTLSFVDGGGNPTDIDGNGRNDAGVREIFYNDDFAWGINTSSPIDVETIALHEAGHGLSQAHFGKLFATSQQGQANFHFAPRAVMNAAYTGIQQSIGQSDEAGHCTNWGSWPNN